MGNCAIKPKVLKDSEDDLVPVERDTAAPVDHDKNLAEKTENNAPNAAEEAAAAARRSEKGKEILIEDDDVDEHNIRPSLSNLFHENKIVETEVTDLSPIRPGETNNKTGASSDVSKLDTSDLMTSHVKDQEECVTFDVQTRNDLEVKIPKDSQVKTPDTPKAKIAEENEGNFSENWEVKFPEEMEATKTSEAVKVSEVSDDKVSSPELSEVNKVVKESDAPEVLEDKSVPEVSAPPLSEIKNVPQVLEDKNIPNVKTDEVEAAESELLKVSEVTSPKDLEIKVPEIKTPETSNVRVTDESEVNKIDEEEVKAAKVDEEEAEVVEFIDAKEKIEKSDQDKDIVSPKTEENEEKDVSLEKQVKESDLGNK